MHEKVGTSFSKPTRRSVGGALVCFCFVSSSCGADGLSYRTACIFVLRLEDYVLYCTVLYVEHRNGIFPSSPDRNHARSPLGSTAGCQYAVAVPISNREARSSCSTVHP